MGTRADFYSGKGKRAEWLGSIAWDGSEIPDSIANAKTDREYRGAVLAFLDSRDDATLPKQGWPWPWDDSGTSDCSYWFFDGETYEAQGSPDVYSPRRVTFDDYGADEDRWDAYLGTLETVAFPDMSAKKKVTLGKRSGVIVIGSLVLGLTFSLALAASSVRAEPPLVCDQITTQMVAGLAGSVAQARDDDKSLDLVHGVWEKAVRDTGGGCSVPQQAAMWDFMTDVYKSKATPGEAMDMAAARCDGIVNGTVAP
jgi:hypothetical protein